MAETKYILVLANSVRAGKHCVAGKLATRRSDGTFAIEPEWIRLTDPQNAEGAVSDATTICPGHGPIHPLDIIKLDLRESCHNPNHPEDWYFEPHGVGNLSNGKTRAAFRKLQIILLACGLTESISTQSSRAMSAK